MIKGMAKVVNHLVLENKEKFEEERKYSIRKHHVYDITVKDKLYLDDEKDRYFHIYHSTGKLYRVNGSRDFCCIRSIDCQKSHIHKAKEELERIDEKPNYMTVPAAIRELEKIEMIRDHDQIYRLDYAVTKTQKTILKAFGMDTAYVKHRADRISEQLKIADNIGR